MTALAISMASYAGTSRLQPGQGRDERGREYEEDYCDGNHDSVHTVSRGSLGWWCDPRRVPSPQAANPLLYMLFTRTAPADAAFLGLW